MFEKLFEVGMVIGWTLQDRMLHPQAEALYGIVRRYVFGIKPPIINPKEKVSIVGMRVKGSYMDEDDKT